MKTLNTNALNSRDSREVKDYGYRYYHPELGRWISRDPIGERGGVNLYGFVENRPTYNLDLVGLQSYSSRDEAGAAGAAQALDKYKANQDDRAIPEYCGNICCNKEVFEITGPYPGKWLNPNASNYIDRQPSCKVPPEGACEKKGPGWKKVGSYHSHPHGFDISPEDKQNVDTDPEARSEYISQLSTTGDDLIYRYDADPAYSKDKGKWQNVINGAGDVINGGQGTITHLNRGGKIK